MAILPCSSSLAFFSGGSRSRRSSSGQNFACSCEESGRGDERLEKSCKFLEGEVIGGEGGTGALGDMGGAFIEGGLLVLICEVFVAGLAAEISKKKESDGCGLHHIHQIPVIIL